MLPCIILSCVLFLVLKENGAIARSSELRKHDAKLSILTSKMETMQMEVKLVNDDLQDQIKILRENMDQERQRIVQILERLKISNEFNIKEEKPTVGEPCSCPEIDVLKNALQEIGTNVSRRIMILEEKEKQKEKNESDKMLFTPQNLEVAAVRGFGKEKLARKKLEAEMSLKFLGIENKFSKISDICQSHQPRFNETIIAQQMMNESLRYMSVQVESIQTSLTELRNGQDLLFSITGQLNGSSNSLFLEMNAVKFSQKIMKDNQEQLSSKTEEMSRLLANISLEMKKFCIHSHKDDDVSKIKQKLLEAGIMCHELITEGEEILKSLKVGSRVVHGMEQKLTIQNERHRTIGTVTNFSSRQGMVFVSWDSGTFSAHRKNELYICT